MLANLKVEREEIVKWDLLELSDLVDKKHGSIQKKILEPFSNSIGRKFEIARYHSFEFRRLTNKYFTTDKLLNYQRAVGFIFDRFNKDETALAYFNDCFISEANVVAYSQSIHSIFDILGQTIIAALNIDHFFNPTKDIYLSTVKKKLDNNKLANDIVVQIENAINSEPFKYLRAFVNTNKHLCLLEMPHTVLMSTEEEIPYGIRIAQFNYHKDSYQQKWAKIFVIDEFEEIAKQIVGIGNSINDYLR
jgi:hypothetical protein